MESTSLGLRALPLPSLSRSCAVVPYSRSLCFSESSNCRITVSAQSVRILASASENSDSESNDGEVASSSLGLSVEEIEEKFRKRRRSSKGKRGEAKAQPKPQPKDFESMTLAEKAWELYVGEKGALYWLNKIAYAAIFVIVGGWVVFRFVGPALNLYQLESPLLPPDQVFGGSK
ncbi:hypothetical protein KP509_02G000100 [Ceratopteris richardii]|uniref:Uncharacterized protein n=1 Tax=Ceratopteris richardii TaxID=49495 RepID=A0A8T2V5U9_CERRI|nr:hypothetical protein KP509_02G000100 [Ceratopteris richardii]